MKQEQIVPIVVIVVVIAVIAAAGLYFATNPAVWEEVTVQMGLTVEKVSGLGASGFVEVEEVTVAPELGGRVLDLPVREGEEVEAGQVVARLDGALLEAQIDVARAGLEVAQAQLAQVKAGANPEQVEQARAGLALAMSRREGSYQAWQDLIALRDDPQRMDAQIEMSEANLAAARAALAQATALKDAAEIGHDAYERAQDKLQEIPAQYRPGMQMSFNLIPNSYWKAWVGVNTAQVKLDGARETLRDQRAMRDNPQDLNARIAEAEAQVRASGDVVRMAQAQLDVLEAGATSDEVAIAEAQVEQARAALDRLTALEKKQVIAAPVGGIVLGVSVHEGELAAPGTTLLTLGDLDLVTLTVYVPEDQLGQINIGQKVAVHVDSFPTRTFEGTVVAIADQAEFTPRNVQTRKARVSMVFAVDVHIPNSDHALKPGLPADAVIDTEEQ